MRKFITVALCIISLSSAFAQKAVVKDTIRVAALQKFNVPTSGALVFANLLKFSCTADLLDKDMKTLRAVKFSESKPKKEEFTKAASGGRGATVWIIFSDYVDKPGTYYVKVNYDTKGELGALTGSVLYMIIVSNPTLASAVDLREKYFPGEKESFSFATVEYQDLNLYTYKLTESGGAVLLQGKGPIVKIDSVLKNPANVGKKIKVLGLYQGNEFTFKNPVTGKFENSTWEFTVEKPAFEQFSSWSEKENDQWLMTVYTAASKQILYVYIGSTPSGFAITTPELNGLRVISDPENFVTGGTQRKSSSFKAVDLQVNQDFLDQMKTGDEQKVKVTISFRTQFGEPIKKDYYAVIVK